MLECHVAASPVSIHSSFTAPTIQLITTGVNVFCHARYMCMHYGESMIGRSCFAINMSSVPPAQFGISPPPAHSMRRYRNNSALLPTCVWNILHVFDEGQRVEGGDKERLFFGFAGAAVPRDWGIRSQSASAVRAVFLVARPVCGVFGETRGVQTILTIGVRAAQPRTSRNLFS